MEDEQGVIFPDSETDYHGHPNYGKILISLLILFSVSLVVGYLFSPMIAISLIFATAVWKTSLVVKNFMHLQFEPLLIWIVVAVALFTIFVFFWGVYPDITAVTRDVVPR